MARIQDRDCERVYIAQLRMNRRRKMARRILPILMPAERLWPLQLSLSEVCCCVEL